MKIDVTMVKSILDDQYDAVKEFFEKVLTIECSQKILLTRRSYVLYKIFKTILEDEYAQKGKSLNVKGTFYNTHSLSAIHCENLDDVLVIDDIVVNGRTVLQVIGELEEYGIKNECISVWCIKCNVKAKYLEDLKPYFSHVKYVMPYEWEQFSDLLTRVIVQSFIGYISYIDSYKIDALSLSDIKSLTQKNLIWKDNKADFFTKASINASIGWGELIDKAITDKYRIKTCIRVYEKSNDSSSLIIPYVFLPALYTEYVSLYCKNLLKDLNIGIPNVFNNTHLDDSQLKILYKWTISSLCKKIMQDFIKKHSIVECTKCFDCSESYISIPEVTEIPIDCKEIDIDSAIAVNESNQSIEFCRGIFREACLKNKQFATHFSLYVSKMRSEDEKVKERHLGLPIFDMTNKVDKDKMYLCDDLENILSTVISYWDCGKAAFVVEKYKSSKTDKNIISTFVRHGEQSFREYFSLYKDVYEVFYQFFLRTRETKEAKILKMAQYFDKKCSTCIFGEFAEGLKYDSYFADLMAVTPSSISSKCSMLVDVPKAINNYVENYYEV